MRCECSSCSHYYRHSRPHPLSACCFTSLRGFSFICTSEGKSPQVVKPHVDPQSPRRDVCVEFFNWAHIGSGKWRCPSRGQLWTDLKISATWFTRDRKSVPTHPFTSTTSSFKCHFTDLTTCSLLIKLDRKALRSL